MLVTFKSSTSGQIMMFSPVARQLLEIIGKDCGARGVITCEQLPDAIHKLRLAADGTRSQSPAAAPDPDATGGDDDEAEGPTVALAQRAYPLIELLEWTRKEDGFVLWEAAKDF
ncbi:MAG: DUF1840 domain-containing protein [Candidatus Accumulibacter sp.]|uniref:DUF1840 domain-containing protein n=1 Tax=Accumulibacter sp. TaxID=2053492 RepID=UPI001A0097C0|nr:DUF1840 domain-containing protein [Accumulibacter sp.]MBE2259043.1 DUF1840 domain-containing protein [Paracoccaceae bacterium]MCP5247171.1 DUF1840 domain-containing protein [Accumulibacter sp.]